MLASYLVDGAASAADARENGFGYRQSDATSSELTRAVRGLPNQGTLVSNNAPQVAWALHHSTVLQVPRTGYQYPALGYLTPEAFLDLLHSTANPVYFAMYSANPRQADTVEEMKGYGIHLTLIETASDGLLFVLQLRDSPA